MGLTTVTGTVRNGSQERTLDFIVDSGAVYSLLPREVWQALELQPQDRQTFRLADTTPIVRDLSQCEFELDQRSTYTWVILGEPGDVALLGAYTLEGLRLTLNPFNRTLQPMVGILA